MNNEEKAPREPASETDSQQGFGGSAMSLHSGATKVDPLCAPDGWIPDQYLDALQRAELAEFTAPRVGLNGQTVWPADEVWP